MRVRRSLLNFGTMVLYVAVTTLVALKTTRWFQDALGSVNYGAVRVVTDAYGYLTLLELGLGGALGPLLVRAIGRRDEGALAATVSAGFRGYLKVSALTLVIGLALTPVVPLFVKDLVGPQIADMRTAWLVGLVSFMSLVMLPLRSVVEAHQLGYVVNLLLTVQSLCVTALGVVLAGRGWGITGQSLAIVAGAWGFNLSLLAVVARSHPGLIRSAVAAPPDPETRRAVRNLSWPSLIVNVSGRVSILTDNLVIGPILGGAKVNSLFNTQRLASLGQTVLQAVGGAAWAGMAELHAQGHRETFNRRLIELSRLVAVLSAAGLAPVVAYNRAFLAVWLGLDAPNFQYGGDAVIVVAALNVFLLGQQSLWAWCFTATGKVRRVAVVGAGSAALNLAASILLTHAIGLVGPLVGTTIALVAGGSWALPLLLRRDFGTPVGPLLRAVGGPLAWGVVSASALWRVARAYEPTTWVGVLGSMGVSALVSLAFGVAVLMTPEDRALWRGRFLSMSGSTRRPPGEGQAAATAPRSHAAWLAALMVAYALLFAAFYPPMAGVDDETGFLNQALVWSRGAVSAEGAGFGYGLADFIEVDGRHVPARHPGRSLVALPFLAAGGVRATFASGLLLHLLMTAAGAALLARQNRSPLWAALLLFHPTLAIYSRTIMADGASGAGLLLAALAVASGSPVGAGLAVGLSASMRYHAGMALPLVAATFVYPPDPGRPRSLKSRSRDAAVCLAVGGAAGLLLVAYNMKVYGTPTEPFTGRRGVFGVEFLTRNSDNLWFYATALMVIWPGLLLAPLFDRSRLRWLLRGSIVIFLGPLLFYYFHDRAPGWLETAVLGQRLVQVVLPLWVVAYAGVLDDRVVPTLRRFLGKKGWTVAVSLGCVGLLAANGLAFAMHQAKLRAALRAREEIVARVPADALIVHSGAVTKFIGTPSGLPYYRLRPLDWMGYPVDPPEALDRDLACETRPWFVAVLRRHGHEAPNPLTQDLIDRHHLHPVPLDTPFVSLFTAGGTP